MEMGMKQLEATPKRQSQVTLQINNLESNIAVLHDSIGKLEARLSIILRSSVPSEKATEGKARKELVLLACSIEGFADSVGSANYKIEDILERLEL